jgi:hypothetical protein
MVLCVSRGKGLAAILTRVPTAWRNPLWFQRIDLAVGLNAEVHDRPCSVLNSQTMLAPSTPRHHLDYHGPESRSPLEEAMTQAVLLITSVALPLT